MHPTFHRLIFWAHLVAGLAAGLIIASLAGSGLLIAYETQLMDWANRDLRVTPPAAGLAARLDPQTLADRVRAAQPGFTPGGFTWQSDPAAPVTLSAGRDQVLYADPYTGAVLGEGAKTWHDFFHAVTSWHRFLTQTGLERETGKAITGAGTLIFGVLVGSGLYLWWPRHWRLANLRAALWINRRLRGRARDWNWHNAIGFWSALPLLAILLTGLVMSYGWANTLLFRLAGSEPPPPRQSAPAGGRPGGAEGATRPAAPVVSLARLGPLLAEAQAAHPDWRRLSLRLPTAPGQPFPLMLDRGGRGQPHLRTMLQLDPVAGAVRLSPDDFSKQNPGRRLRMYARYLHTGELFGFAGQTVAALASLAALILVWTGFSLAWRRFRG